MSVLHCKNDICNKGMRSDNLKNHSNIHTDSASGVEEEAKQIEDVEEIEKLKYVEHFTKLQMKAFV